MVWCSFVFLEQVNQQNRIPEAEPSKSFLLSICPTSLLLFLHYKAVWVLLRVSPGGEGRAAECKREEKSTHQTKGVAVSRKLDVLQPTTFWKLKHPTDTELLNVTRKERQKNFTLQPCNVFFFKTSKKHWQKMFTARQQEHNVSTTQWKSRLCHWAAHYDLTILHSLLWHSVGVLYLFTKMHSAAKSFKNTSYVALTGSVIYIKKERNVRPSIDTIQSCSSECQSTFRITLLWG